MLELDPAVPQRLSLEGRNEHGEAIDTLLAWAQRSVAVFDHDLDDTGWSSPRRAELLAGFFQRSRLAKLEIFLRETRTVQARLPRLAALWRLQAHAFSIYQVGEEALGLFDPFMIVDRQHYWRRFHYQQPRGELGIAQPEYAEELARRIQEIREISGPPAAVTVLGL